MDNILKILNEIQDNLNLVYDIIGMEKNNNNSARTRNENQKKWYRWRKRAERVSVPMLESRRPNMVERDKWKKEIINKEKQLGIKANNNKKGYNINSDGSIYMIKDETSGFTKIGFTSQKVKTRLSGLQTSNPNKLAIYKSYKGSLSDESTIHYYLQENLKLDHRGEWFHLNDNAVKYIDDYFSK